MPIGNKVIRTNRPDVAAFLLSDDIYGQHPSSDKVPLNADMGHYNLITIRYAWLL
jgi:hypothetical protein